MKDSTRSIRMPRVFTPNASQIQLLRQLDSEQAALDLKRDGFVKGMLSNRPDLSDVEGWIYDLENCSFMERLNKVEDSNNQPPDGLVEAAIEAVNKDNKKP